MTKTVHLSLSVRGAIRNGAWRKELVGCCRGEDGRLLTADEIFDELCGHLAAGHEVIPFGEPCEGWDWKDGCPGHEVETVPE